MPIKYFSMFSGIGGFEYGMQQSEIDFESVGHCEVDKYAESIYSRHFPHSRNFGDATKINTKELPRFDFLVGGFPCQAFSVAGQRKGFSDTRGTLFFEIARILKDKRPRYFLLENVAGLLHHEKGETFKTILEVLSELGYDVQWEILNSKEIGNVPQNRERVFIKGYSRRECRGEVLLVRGTDTETCNEQKMKTSIQRAGNISPTNHWRSDVLETTGISRSLTCNDYKEPVLIKEDTNPKIKMVGNISNTGHRGGGVFSMDGICPTLTSSDYKHPKNILVEEDFLKVRESTKKGYKEAYPYDGILTNRSTCKVAKGIVKHQQCGCLKTDGVWGTVTSDYRIRRLTPVECERLQGFPDQWTKYGKDDELISDTQRYKCIGNAVTTTVITAIVNRMFMDVEV